MPTTVSASAAYPEQRRLPTRTKRVIVVSWCLFWSLMIAVAIQDYLRSGGTQLWQPVVWESTSALCITFLLLVQRHFSRPFDRLLATPRRWFALQILWLPLQWILFVPMAFGLRHGVFQLAGSVYRHAP